MGTNMVLDGTGESEPANPWKIDDFNSGWVNRRNSDGSEHEEPALTIVNAIESLNFDLNAAAFSETTNISNDYIADSLILNFSTDEIKTITILDPNGTIIIGGTEDQTCKNPLYNTTKKNFNIPINRSFNADNNLTVTITQTSGACITDVVLKVQEGESTLNGTPVLGAGNEIIGQVKITDGTSIVEVDPTNKSISADPHEEITINAGNHYFVRDVYDFLDSNPVYFMFRTPNTSTRINAFVNMTAEAEFTATIFKDATVSADGTPITPQNNDQDSSNTPELTPFASPTVTDDGDQVLKFKVGVGKDSGVNAFHHKIKAKTNSIYLFKLVSEEGAKWIDVDFYWYENS